MRRSNIFYLVWLLATIGAIYAIVQSGNRLQAPAALPKVWEMRVGGDCALLPLADSSMTLKQSGETVEVLLLQTNPLSLHGKLGRDGAFRFSGEVRNPSLGCRRGKVVWEGRASRASIDGSFKVEGEDCPLCPQALLLAGKPELPEAGR